MHRNRADLALGLGAVVLALLAIVVWVPNDSATSVIVKLRGRVSIGDALAPVAAFVLITVAGLLIAVEARIKETNLHLSRSNLAFIALLTGVFLVAVLLMRWTGPTMVALFGPDGASYRDLRDTMPWKLGGFVAGGTFLASSLMAITQRRISWTFIAIGLLTVAGLVLVFDLPFSDLLLPPNGDL